MIHLYVKQHTETGLKYFGRTYQNPFKYRGSGYRWREHLKKHGSHIDTLSVWSYLDNDIELASKDALEFSVAHNIANSADWANMILENVYDGHHEGYVPRAAIESSANKRRGQKRSAEDCAKISASLTGRHRSEETKAKLRAANLGKKLAPETIAKMKAAQSKRVSPKHNEETKARLSAMKREWWAAKKRQPPETSFNS